MKLVQTTMNLLAASFVLFSFSQCKKESAPNPNAEESVVLKSNKMMQEKTYTATLSSLNNSGASGTATLVLDGNKLTVTIDAMGLEANKVHPQHIHGFMENNKNSTCPTMAADTNGDGLVDLVEGLPFYGPVLLPLDPFPTADAMGRIHYMKTFDVTSDLLPLQNRAIVLHGLTVNGSYMPTLPVACGQIQSANGQWMNGQN